MNIQIDDNFLDMGKYFSRSIVEILSKKYNFDMHEAYEFLGINIKHNYTTIDNVDNKRTKKTIPLPFVGIVNQSCCQGIRLNYGLYTQCTNDSNNYNYEYPLCYTCSKQASANSNNMPTYGFINERIIKGKDFRDPKGKAPVPYANVLEKLKIDISYAQRVAKDLGIIIPENEFIVKKGNRGRPRKDTTADDTASETSSSSDKPEKRRGRPRKNKEIIVNSSINDDDDQIENMLKSINNNSKIEDNNILQENTNIDIAENSDEEQIEVQPIIIKKGSSLGYIVQDEQDNKTQYLLSGDKKLYHVLTYELVGVWDSVSKKISTIESDSD
tara:strand:+ start:874 stop:1857 length:984 start_codon:yes stop_codon:yes gene_type:complete